MVTVSGDLAVRFLGEQSIDGGDNGFEQGGEAVGSCGLEALISPPRAPSCLGEFGVSGKGFGERTDSCLSVFCDALDGGVEFRVVEPASREQCVDVDEVPPARIGGATLHDGDKTGNLGSMGAQRPRARKGPRSSTIRLRARVVFFGLGC